MSRTSLAILLLVAFMPIYGQRPVAKDKGLDTAKVDDQSYQLATNLRTPNTLTTIRKSDVDEKLAAKLS